MSRISTRIAAAIAVSLTVAAGCGKDSTSAISPGTSINPRASYTVSGVAFEYTSTAGHYMACITPPGVGGDQQVFLGVSKDGYVPGSAWATLGSDYSGVNVQLVRK